MDDKDQVVGIETIAPLIEQLGKAFLELEAHNDAAEDNVQWSEIEEYFRHLETTMKKKIEELELKEKEFKEKESGTSAFLAERESVVTAKEQDLLDRIQELKDAAVAAIAEAMAKYQPQPLEAIDGDDKETKVSSSLDDTNTLLIDAPEENSQNTTGENAEGDEVVEPRPELMQFCEQMDVKGLLSYTMENKKDINALRSELSVALKSATEPSNLVLASLEGFYPPTQEGEENDDDALRGMRQSCIMFMEAMTTLLKRADDNLLSPESKQQAKAIADDWKPKLAAANGNSLEAKAFLQLLATFRIASEFDKEELCKLVLLAVANQRRAPELCRSLGLTDQMPGFIEELVESGRQIDAVHFIHAFKLTESFPPVPLLKTYLKDLRRNSQGKPGGGGTGAMNEANAQELAALRAVIRCVRDYNLEAEYPLDPLQKRVAQLENSRPDKKRPVESVKQQQYKKPRANGGRFGSRAPGHSRSGPPPAAAAAGGGRQVPPVYGERTTLYAGMTERYPPAVPTAYDYENPSQSAYAQQAYDQRSYYYPQDDQRVAPSTYAAPPSSYGGYAGSGAQPSHQQFM
jgi:hypothetical protein